MKITETPINGLLELSPAVFEDSRGYFFESFRMDKLAAAGVNKIWVQENQSFSKKGTVRGLHYQAGTHAQAKLVRVIQGKVLDVAVDLRKNSETYGKSYAVLLDSKLHNMFYIPEGFAHGFSVLEDAIFSYKCSAYYHKESEGGIIWSDPQLLLDWKIDKPIISEKDELWPTFDEFDKRIGGL
ncbi:dTDP-4-dehydrorhamnose 3,5-epimerase [Belliella kenyensis]|uniref:dTDP-4-dehydrorhamnose 3,5-epimerase n=1 Tax=Belliella kenyensis TaxID=1472724 RepID=A0ABV8EMM3_9BACT|nr:dTDP-4-dehydrorhamnose 3,5-epimerase [Belliella kenyensis]MCH7401625.1 dTDP-4-dehydrorhamnose 3,5-epimerase [Belliella kenyensis]MDN3603097.1 dTDP-4-dehydrorhamnose 3,5-epimerase [Belliella kenyensis]